MFILDSHCNTWKNAFYLRSSALASAFWTLMTTQHTQYQCAIVCGCWLRARNPSIRTPLELRDFSRVKEGGRREKTTLIFTLFIKFIMKHEMRILFNSLIRAQAFISSSLNDSTSFDLLYHYVNVNRSTAALGLNIWKIAQNPSKPSIVCALWSLLSMYQAKQSHRNLNGSRLMFSFLNCSFHVSKASKSGVLFFFMWI